MIILEIITALIYSIVIFAIVLLILALAIPLGLLFGIYWLLFKSWRRRKKSKDISVTKVSKKDVADIVSGAISKATASKNDSSKKFDESIQKIVKFAKSKHSKEEKDA